MLNLTKRITACFLALVMVLTLVPQTVFAEETTASPLQTSSLQYEVLQEINEDKTEAAISLKFTETETVQLKKITLPDGTEKAEELSHTVYTVCDNGTYDFKVEYSMDGFEQEEIISVQVTELKEQEHGNSELTNDSNVLSSTTIKEAASWADLKSSIESASSDTTISVKGTIEKQIVDERIVVPDGVSITIVGEDVKFIRPSTSNVGEFYVSDNSKLILQGNYIVEAKKYDEGKGSLSHAHFVEVSEKGILSLEGKLVAHTSSGFFNGKYGKLGFIYCKGSMVMSNDAAISGWTIYDTSVNNSRNAAIVIDGSSANLTMNGGEITGNYNVGSNAVAGAAVQVHSGGCFVMNNGNIHDNGIISEAKNNTHYGSGVFINGENSSFKMTGGAIQNNNGMIGAGIYISGSKNSNAFLEITGGSINNNNITNIGKSGCNGGGIYAKYADVNICGNENEKINISYNGSEDFGTEYNFPQTSGGGIYAENSTINLNYITVDHNKACGNNAQGGAGIWLKNSEAIIQNGSISNNQGGKYNHNFYGGALRIEGKGNVNVENITLENNRVSPESDYQYNTGFGGAIMMNGEDKLIIQDCIITKNHASASGGGLYANQGITEIKGSTLFEGNTSNNDRENWEDYLGEAICITSVATVKIYDEVMINKNNTVGLEADKNGIAVLTMANSYSGINKEHPVFIESMKQDIEKLPDSKGTPLVVFLEEAGGEKGAAYADEQQHFIASSYMANKLQVGQSGQNKNVLTYVSNHAPTINATDRVITVGDEFDPLKDVSATDKEDGDITLKSENIIENEVDTKKTGIYKVTYKVTDSKGASSTKTIYVTVNPKMESLNQIPTINAVDKTINVGDEFDPLKDVTATDKEDGDLNGKIEILKNEVDTGKVGGYEVTYKVTDSQGASSVKTIKVTVKEKEGSVIPSQPDKPERPTGQTNKPNTDQSENHSTSIAKGAETGDSMQPILWAVFMVASCVVLYYLYKRKK